MDFINSIKSVLVKMFRLSNWTKWEQIVVGCTITFGTLITALIDNPDDPLRKIAYWMSFALYSGCVVAALLLFGRRSCASTQRDVAEEIEMQTTAPRRSCASTQRDVAEEIEIQTTAPRRSPASITTTAPRRLPESITTTAPKRGSAPIASVAPRRRSAPITIATPSRPRPSSRVTFEHEPVTPSPYSARPFNPEEVSEPGAFGMFSSGVDENRPLQHYLDRQEQMEAEEVEERVAQHERFTYGNFLTRSSECTREHRRQFHINSLSAIETEYELVRQERQQENNAASINQDHTNALQNETLSNLVDAQDRLDREYAREQRRQFHINSLSEIETEDELERQERQQVNNAASINQDHTNALQNENFSNLVGSPPLRRNNLAEALEDEDRVRRDTSSPTRDDVLD